MRVTIPERPPCVVILHPQDGMVLGVNAPARLPGKVTTAWGEPVQDVEARWLVDSEEVARELDVLTFAPAAGEHRCTLFVRAGTTARKRTVRSWTLAVLREGREGEGPEAPA